MLSFLALILAIAQSPTHLTLAPWTGKSLPTATAAGQKYRLTITGTPGVKLHLKTSGVADGWIGAFCDMRVCAPIEVDETLPASGTVSLQFELIREMDSSPAHTAATITSSDGATVSTPK